MNPEKILDDLLNAEAETEILEFKEAKNDYSFVKIGKYFSALSNEANLKGESYAWLIFGIKDKDHSVVGTSYRKSSRNLQSLKGEIANKVTNNITFMEIYEVTKQQKRVLLFQIPAAPKGIPVSFEGHYYGRNGEELSPLNIEEIERIRSQIQQYDWSFQILPEATIDDLDKTAIELARNNFKNKFPEKATDLETWDDITFLNKAKITIKGKITKTAILLLGKEESEYHLNPAEAKIRWLLKDSNGNNKDYSIYSCPFILAIDKVYHKIRNLKYRYLQERSLFPEEIDQYEPYTIREALNNCIAHQDYTKAGRIDVIEMEDQLLFSNIGNFIPGTVEKVIMDDAPEQVYRNPFLVTAMFNLKMVDTMGGGIRKMYIYQKERFFPMPDYNISEGKVKVTITGKILNMDYARILANYTDLSLNEIFLLDKVQKKKDISENEKNLLKKRNLIEGRKPNYYPSKTIAQKMGQKADYSKNKAFDQQYYLDLILKAIKEHGHLERKDIDELLWEKLPNLMNDEQKKNKIHNLISELREQKKIQKIGETKGAHWKLF
ncbi:MAG: RNA-binding domain-containing protein [Spirochaetota bacterium]